MSGVPRSDGALKSPRHTLLTRSEGVAPRGAHRAAGGAAGRHPGVAALDGSCGGIRHASKGGWNHDQTLFHLAVFRRDRDLAPVVVPWSRRRPVDACRAGRLAGGSNRRYDLCRRRGWPLHVPGSRPTAGYLGYRRSHPSDPGRSDHSLSRHGRRSGRSGNTAYVAAGTSGLRVFSVANLAAPIEIGAYDTPDWASGVAVAGNFASSPTGPAGLQVVNVANPATPIEVGFYDTPGTPRRGHGGNYAYVTDEDTGLLVIDVAHPAAPVKVGSASVPATGRGGCRRLRLRRQGPLGCG